MCRDGERGGLSDCTTPCDEDLHRGEPDKEEGGLEESIFQQLPSEGEGEDDSHAQDNAEYSFATTDLDVWRHHTDTMHRSLHGLDFQEDDDEDMDAERLFQLRMSGVFGDGAFPFPHSPSSSSLSSSNLSSSPIDAYFPPISRLEHDDKHKDEYDDNADSKKIDDQVSTSIDDDYDQSDMHRKRDDQPLRGQFHRVESNRADAQGSTKTEEKKEESVEKSNQGRDGANDAYRIMFDDNVSAPAEREARESRRRTRGNRSKEMHRQFLRSNECVVTAAEQMLYLVSKRANDVKRGVSKGTSSNNSTTSSPPSSAPTAAVVLHADEGENLKTSSSSAPRTFESFLFPSSGAGEGEDVRSSSPPSIFTLSSNGNNNDPASVNTVENSAMRSMQYLLHFSSPSPPPQQSAPLVSPFVEDAHSVHLTSHATATATSNSNERAEYTSLSDMPFTVNNNNNDNNNNNNDDDNNNNNNNSINNPFVLRNHIHHLQRQSALLRRLQSRSDHSSVPPARALREMGFAALAEAKPLDDVFSSFVVLQKEQERGRALCSSDGRSECSWTS